MNLDLFWQYFGRFLRKLSRKLAKILRGVTQLNFDKKPNWMLIEKNTKLNVDKKMHNYVLTEKKKKGQQGTPHCRQPAAKANTRSPKRRVCGSATVPCNQKKIRSSIKRKEVN